MERYYVYILESSTDRKLYIGITSDVNKRLLRHNEGKVFSTRSRRPFRLIHVEEYKSKKEGLRREKYLKMLKSGKYIRSHIVCPDSSIG